jgi:aspartate racemase
MKTIGILGGMGPLAGAYFYRRVVESTAAEGDSFHIPTLLWSDPEIPDRTACLLGDGESPLPALERGVGMLRTMGAEVIAVPCNTAFAYLSQIAETVTIPDMPRLAARRAALGGARCIGILSTRGTLRAGIYERAAASAGLSLVSLPSDAAVLLDGLIYRQKSGERIGCEEYLGFADLLRGAGADAVILGCTELSVAFSGASPSGVVDALEALVNEVVSLCGAPLREEVTALDIRRALAG